MGKNIRTKISTLVAIIAYLNMVLSQMDISVVEQMFHGDPKALFAYKVLSAIIAAIAWANSHYYNQDFTVISDSYTKQMREEKILASTVVPETVEEPEDSGRTIDESEVVDDDE